MADVLSEEQRHKCMSNVKSKNTRPEIMVRRFLFTNGYRFRLHRKDLPGNPDIVLPKHKVAIFINGCFWHGHRNCRFATLPVNNRDFWKSKIDGNIERDKNNIAKLKELGWHVIEIWQCQLKPKNKDITLKKLLTELRYEQR